MPPTGSDGTPRAPRQHKFVPDFPSLARLSLREELHAIQAAVAGRAWRSAAVC
jgi:hypothetical protein